MVHFGVRNCGNFKIIQSYILYINIKERHLWDITVKGKDSSHHRVAMATSNVDIEYVCDRDINCMIKII